MSAEVTFRLGHHERVEASAAVVLVRVSGTFTAAEQVAVGEPLLELDLDAGPRRFPALPDAAGGRPVAGPAGRLWRGAFPLPRDVAEAARGMTLLIADAGLAVELPPAGFVAEAEPAPVPADLAVEPHDETAAAL